MGWRRTKTGYIRAGHRSLFQNLAALHSANGVGLSRPQQPDTSGRCAMGDFRTQCGEPVLDRQFAAYRITLPCSGDVDRQPDTNDV